MKAIEQYFYVVPLTMLRKVGLTFKFEDETLQCKTVHMKATEHCFHVTLFLTLCKVVVTFGGTLKLQY